MKYTGAGRAASSVARPDWSDFPPDLPLRGGKAVDREEEIRLVCMDPGVDFSMSLSLSLYWDYDGIQTTASSSSSSSANISRGKCKRGMCRAAPVLASLLWRLADKPEGRNGPMDISVSPSWLIFSSFSTVKAPNMFFTITFSCLVSFCFLPGGLFARLVWSGLDKKRSPYSSRNSNPPSCLWSVQSTHSSM